METIVSIKPLLAVAVSLVAVIPIVLSSAKPNLREGWTLAAGVIKLIIVASMVPVVLKGILIEYTLAEVLPGVAIRFRVDPLGILFALTASTLWIITSVYSIGYMRGLKEHSQTRYFSFFAIALSSTIGVAFAANLFTLYIFYEMLSLTTYPLVAHHQDKEARSSGRKYLAFILGTSIGLVLPAMLITYSLTGTLEFANQGFLAGKASTTVIAVLLMMFIFGFAKAAIIPFHSWLPAAMVAPTPVSALLHAVAVVKVGVFSILRIIFFVFGIDMLRSLDISTVATYVVSFTIITASIIALTKDNLKARLAYSTISQLSYIILGALLLSPSGMVGGIIHIANHAFSKITLFFCAGSIYVAAHKTNISQLSGIGKKMPWTMAAFFIASLSMIGIPPVAGFVSKWYLAVGSIEAGNYIILIVLLSSTVLNAAYFLPITYKAFFEEPQEDPHHPHEAIKEIPLMVIPLVLTAIGSVIIGLYPDYFIALAKEVIK